MPNVELLKRTLAHIEAHPEEWNQETIIDQFGTACFAGHAVALERGFTMQELFAYEMECENGEDVCALATESLAISLSESNYLFCGQNDLARLRAYVDILCDPKLETEKQRIAKLEDSYSKALEASLRPFPRNP